jgi:hypothetical protein
MKKLLASRAGLAALASVASTGVARASEATGTEAVAEMHVTGAQFGMMVGGLVLLGLVIWGVIKVVNK